MKRLAFLGFLSLVASGGMSSGALVQFSLSTTINNSVMGYTYPAGTSAGENVLITFLADNGNSSVASGTWTLNDIELVTISVDGGSYLLSFDPSGGTNVKAISSGSFVTNGAGVLTAVPTDWRVVIYDVAATTTPATSYRFYMDGGATPVVAFASDFTTVTHAVGNSSFGTLTTLSNWSVAAVPEASSALLGLGGVALAALRRRR